MRKLLEALFARYYKDVYRYLYSLSRDPDLSEDLASEVFLEVVKAIATFRGESDIKTWIFSIARRRWFAWLGRKTKQIPTEELSGDLPSEKTPENSLLDKELANRILQLLDQEPERTRQIVLMRMEGYSFREIGQATGISENSARVSCFRAKERIRQILKKEGFDYE